MSEIITSPLGNDTKKLEAPCNECPYSKTVTPGLLGGSPIDVYIGQGHGPFWLPCHKNVDFKDPCWKEDHSVQQCAGAAIYRANIKRDHLMPGTLHRLPAGDKAFESPEELYAHHTGSTMQEATEYLEQTPADVHMINEFLRAKKS